MQWLLLLALTVVVIALARQIGVLHLRLSPVGALEVDDEGPALGSAPEPRVARTASGNDVLVGGPGSRRLVTFVSPTCPICEQLAPSFPVAARAHGLEPQVVQDPELELAFDVPGVPFVVVLDELGVARAKGTVNTLEQLDGLIDTAERRMRPPLEVVG